MRDVLRALAIAPVVREDTAAAWIARAQAVTVRRLVDEVEWVVERRAAGVSAAASEPPPPGTRLVLPERQMRAHEECPPVDAEIVFFAPASLAVLLREAIAAFAKPLEPSARSPSVSSVPLAARRLRSDRPLAPQAGAADPRA